MVSEAQRAALIKLVRKCRRYFPAGSAVEVWQEFCAPLDAPLEPAAFEVRHLQPHLLLVALPLKSLLICQEGPSLCVPQ